MMKTITYTTASVPDFLDTFAGRLGIGHDDIYAPGRRYKIAECNRDYVWPGTGLQEGFIRDILNKDAVPSIIICNGELIDAGNRSTTLWLFRNNRLSVDDMTYDTLPRHLFGNWSGCHMPVTIIENATEDEKASYYEKYNKGIVLSFGQKLENRKNRPLVAMSMDMIGRGGEFPLRDIQSDVWAARFPKTKARGELGFAYRILVSSMYGSQHFHSNFGDHSRLIMNPDSVPDLTRLNMIYTIIRSADPALLIAPKIKKSAFKVFIGAVIFDSHRMNTEDLRQKWTTFFHRVYNILTPAEVKSACKEASRVRTMNRNREFGDYPGAMSAVVATYLATGEIGGNAAADDTDDDDTTDD